jgi:histone-lysine N-methyltransferase EZH2
MGCPVQARYDILLREAEKKVDTRLQEIKVPETCNVVKSLSPGRRKTSTKDLARAAAKEAREGAKESAREAAKEAALKETTLEANADDHHRSEASISMPAALEEKQTQPKDLLAAMDSFDNLFCRRCLVFDCRLHGCSQAIVHPSERQQPWSNIEDGIPLPCSKHCCLLQILPSNSGRNFVQTDALAGLKVNKRKQDLLKSSQKQQDLSSSQNEDGDDLDMEHKRSRTISGGEIAPSSYRQGVLDSTSKETVESSQKTTQGVIPLMQLDESEELKKLLSPTRKSLFCQPKEAGMQGEGSEAFYSQQSQEGSLVSCEIVIQESIRGEAATSKTLQQVEVTTILDRGDRPVDVGSDKLSSKWLCLTRDKHTEGSDKVEGGIPLEAESKEIILSKKNNVPAPLSMDSEEETRTNVSARGKGKVEVANNWTMLEMGLYEKGLQIFGKNSCLIAKNLLKGFKSCAEVAQYTLEQEASGDGPDGVRRCTDSLDIDAQNRARMYGGRRKGRVRKLKYTWKSVVHPLIRKRMANGKDQPCRQYTPCSCLFTCGKQCPCLLNGTCCEKYCGCSKSCKNRFRGCHCAKSQCCSRQCPCFAAGRECDPDVCRNCWVGCGDGTLGGPPLRGDSYDCRNMKVMLKQQQRVLLGRSDVAGWGAFLKNPVGKHEYLGEYTGELISHREADKRGKIYDRENSSFLFNLNDQASSMSFTEFTFTVTRAMDGCITPFCLDCSIMPATMNEVPGYSFN